jgi:hypothetical protein
MWIESLHIVQLDVPFHHITQQILVLDLTIQALSLNDLIVEFDVYLANPLAWAFHVAGFRKAGTFD